MTFIPSGRFKFSTNEIEDEGIVICVNLEHL